MAHAVAFGAVVPALPSSSLKAAIDLEHEPLACFRREQPITSSCRVWRRAGRFELTTTSPLSLLCTGVIVARPDVSGGQAGQARGVGDGRELTAQTESMARTEFQEAGNVVVKTGLRSRSRQSQLMKPAILQDAKAQSPL